MFDSNPSASSIGVFQFETFLKRWGILLLLGLFICINIPKLNNNIRFGSGDTISDGNVLTTSAFFYNYGFSKLQFTPIIDTFPLKGDYYFPTLDPNTSLSKSLLYTHYPPLPDLIGGIEDFIGGGEIGFFPRRVVALGFTLIGLSFFYLFVRDYFESDDSTKEMAATISLGATLFLVLSPIIFEYADSIHHIPLYFAFGFLTIWALQKYLLNNTFIFFILSCFGYFLTTYASYDFIIFVFITSSFLVIQSALSFRKKALVLLFFGSSSVFALTLKSFFVAKLIGISGLFADLKFQFLERATNAVVNLNYWSLFQNLFVARTIHFIGIPILLIILVSLFLFKNKKRINHVILVLTFATSIFGLFFHQLFVEQPHPFFQISFLCALLFGVALSNFSHSDVPFRKGVIILIIMILAGNFIWYRVQNKIYEIPYTAFDGASVAINSVDHNNAVVLNTYDDPYVRFFLNRHFIGIYGQEYDENNYDANYANFYNWARKTFSHDGSQKIVTVFIKNPEWSFYPRQTIQFKYSDHPQFIDNPYFYKEDFLTYIVYQQGLIKEFLDKHDKNIYENNYIVVYQG